MSPRRLPDRITYDSILLGQNRRFEERTVKYILKRFGLEHHKFELLRAYQKCTGETALTLKGFREYFDTFPVVFSSGALPSVIRTCSLPSVFKQFRQTPMFTAFVNAYRKDPELPYATPFGFVFKIPYLPRGELGLVVHNRVIDITVPSTRVLWNDDEGRQLVVEPMSTLLDSIAKDWPEPDERDWLYRESSNADAPSRAPGGSGR